MILTPRGMRQEDCELQANLGYPAGHFLGGGGKREGGVREEERERRGREGGRKQRGRGN